jgi:3-deoxy-D-manno-octulosonate 8-phosphate phosphatase KdsC-like HAD superfamily phosphatase
MKYIYIGDDEIDIEAFKKVGLFLLIVIQIN